MFTVPTTGTASAATDTAAIPLFTVKELIVRHTGALQQTGQKTAVWDDDGLSKGLGGQ